MSGWMLFPAAGQPTVIQRSKATTAGIQREPTPSRKKATRGDCEPVTKHVNLMKVHDRTSGSMGWTSFLETLPPNSYVHFPEKVLLDSKNQ